MALVEFLGIPINTGHLDAGPGGWMRNLRNLAWIMLMLGLLALAGHAAAEVDWTDEVTDEGGDVTDEAGNPAEFPAADIRSVTITEEGDNINVTMTLEVSYNESGTYSVSVVVDDGEDAYGFSRGVFPEFGVTDPSGGAIDVDGYYSADGKSISWVVAKADVPASESLDIMYAMAIVVDYLGSGHIYQDSTEITEFPTEMPVPDSWEIVMSMPKLNILQMQITMTYKGEDADALRSFLDDDKDGTVSDAELAEFLKDMEPEEPPDPAEANVTLDGKDPKDLQSDYSIEGGKGLVESSADFKMVVKMRAVFPDVEEKSTHDVEFKEPFGEDLIGGDEPWENEFEMSLKFRAPDGWFFKAGTFPPGMKEYLNDDGDEVTMNTEDIKADWNNTFADLKKFTIQEDEDSPGFGLVATVVTATVVAFTVRRRR